MTQALCLHCGAMKFGAFNPCSECGGNATGNERLDVTFSDHWIAESTLFEFGKLVNRLRSLSPDRPDVRFWTFVRFVSERYGSILSAEVPAKFHDAVHELMARVEFPEIVVEPGRVALRQAMNRSVIL